MHQLRKKRDTDNPKRLRSFLENMKNKQSDFRDLQALNTLFEELCTLIHDDVLYYERIRAKHRRISTATRLTAFVFGTLGVLAPLLSSVVSKPDNLAACGYPLFAIAGSALLFNRMFGATKGHVRYVTAHLALQNLITLFYIDWSSWKSQHPQGVLSDEDITSAFALFKKFVGDAGKLVQDETIAWGQAVMEDMESAANQLIGKGSSNATPQQPTLPNPGKAPTTR
ncbi:SLATT domain-containing protein [Pseudomonas asplenii]|uniref:SLATT domain-containing protein n=1 Tax=Pseudomonas asplenii TaxID=53407 RepID=UPI0023617B2F|nr:SLATT domain-containing protein [Pseudomonas asplenii]